MTKILNKEELTELGIQAGIAFVIGFCASLSAAQALNQAAVIGALVAGIKGLLAVVVKLLQPEVVSAGKKYTAEHWTKRLERLI